MPSDLPSPPGSRGSRGPALTGPARSMSGRDRSAEPTALRILRYSNDSFDAPADASLALRVSRGGRPPTPAARPGMTTEVVRVGGAHAYPNKP